MTFTLWTWLAHKEQRMLEVITVMLVKLQKQVAIVEKIKVIFNKNITIIKSSRQDQKVKVLIIFCLSLPVTNNWTLILACFDFSCMIHANSSIELKHLI